MPSSGHSVVNTTHLHQTAGSMHNNADQLTSGPHPGSLPSQSLGGLASGTESTINDHISSVNDHVSTMASHLHGHADQLDTTASNYEANEEHVTSLFRGIGLEEPTTTHPGGTRSPSPVTETDTSDHSLPAVYQQSGPSVEHPNGIVSTPVSSFHGFKGIGDWQRYKNALNGVQRPSGTSGQGNNDPNWQGWYLGEGQEQALGYATHPDLAEGGAVLQYDYPHGATVHDIPESMSTDVGALKSHFGIPDDKPLLDGLGEQNGILRLHDPEWGSEVVVPWNLASNGTASHVGFNDLNSGQLVKGTTPPRRHAWTSNWNEYQSGQS